jgi:uncharacterized membrane protein YkvA (DUF1232 family)
MVNEFNEEKAHKIIKEEAKKVKREDVKSVIEKEEEIKSKVKGPLKRYFEDIKLFFSLLKDFISGEYTEVPWFTIAAITVSLLYVLNPVDVIPDFIPIIGQIDDAVVVSVCLMLIEEDLEAYKNWKLSRTN